MLEDFRQVTLKNSRAHSKSTPESIRPPQPSGQVRHCRGQWGRLSLSFPELSHGKAPRDPNGDRAHFRLTRGSRVRYGSSGTGSLPRSHPTSPGLSSHGLAWPRSAVPPVPKAARSQLPPRCLLASRIPAAGRRSSASPLPQRPPAPAGPLALTSLAASSCNHSRSIPSRRKHQLRPAASCPEPKGSGSPIARSALDWGSAQQPAKLQPPSRVLARTITKQQTEAIAQGAESMGTRARLWAGKAGSARAPRKKGWARTGREEVRTGRAGLTHLCGGRPGLATLGDFVSKI